MESTTDHLHDQLESARLRLQDLYKRAASSPAEQALLEQALEELSISLEELHVSVDEMRRYNEQLAAAHAETAAERRRYQELFEFAPAGYLVTDPAGIIGDANRMAEGMFSRRREHLVHKPIIALITERDHRRFRDLLAALLRADEPGEWETEMLRRNGARAAFPGSLSVFRVCDRQGRLIRLLWLVRDLTERKNAEAVVRQALRRVIALRDINEAMTSTLNLQEILSFLLERIEQFFPYPIAATVRLFNENRQLEYLLCRNIEPADWQNYGARSPGPRARQVIDSKASLVIGNIQTDPRTARRPDFYRRNNLIAYAAVPLVGKEEVVGLLDVYTKEEHEFTYEEVSFLSGVASQAALAIHNSRLYEQLKHQAVELQNARDELERRVAERTAQLRRVNEELRGEIAERLRAESAARESENKFCNLAKQLEGQLIISDRRVSLGELAASLAHEFNNPLAIILALSQEMRAALDAADPRHESMAHIEQEALRCRKIVLDLLGFVRPAESAFVKVDVGEILQNAISLLSVQLRKTNVETALDIEPGLPPICADAQQLRQVVINFAFNAAEAMPQGGTLNIRAATNRPASAAAHRAIGAAPSELVVAIADTGVGIDPQLMSEIFRPFFTTKKSKGMGLGLSICERIVKAHRGRIEVKSTPGAGTTFYLYFPVAEGNTYEAAS